MSMAPLSAALITRNGGPRQIGQIPAQFQAQTYSPAYAPTAPRPLDPAHQLVGKSAPEFAPEAKTLAKTQAKTSAKTSAKTQARKKRAQKTLRLSSRVNQDLVALAKEADVSQQSLMERAVTELVARRGKRQPHAHTMPNYAANDATGARHKQP